MCILRSTLYGKSFLATGANHRVLALGARQSEDCLAFGAFAVNVSFSVLEFVFAELEEAAEFFVFTASLDKIF